MESWPPPITPISEMIQLRARRTLRKPLGLEELRSVVEELWQGAG
jgi:hypothetical protein